MNPNEFLKRWNQKVYPLVHYEEDKLKNLDIPVACKYFLLKSGLPESAAPFLNFESTKNGSLLTLKEKYNVDASYERNTYSKFIADINRLTQEAEQAIFEYYQEECLEYRAMLGGESADEIAPIITTTQQLGKLVDLIGLTILPDFEDGVRRVGLVFNCTWEEDGVGVRFENEEVAKVGYQDIVI